MQEAVRSRKLSEKLEAAEAAASLLKEEVVETRQALSWREEEVDNARTAKTESEVSLSSTICFCVVGGVEGGCCCGCCGGGDGRVGGGCGAIVALQVASHDLKRDYWAELCGAVFLLRCTVLGRAVPCSMSYCCGVRGQSQLTERNDA